MIEAYTGLPGHGKTYNMTKEAYNKAFVRGRDIYANYKLNFPEIKNRKGKVISGQVHYFKELSELTNVRNALILIDEAGIYLPSQAWRDIPFEFMRQLRQHRHDGLDLWYTAQDLGDVVTYLRRITQYEHSFSKVWHFTFKRTINPRSKEKYSFDIYHFSKKYFAFYDTTENVELGDYLKSAMKKNVL